MTDSISLTGSLGKKFGVILFPTEGADSEKTALSIAVRLARIHGAQLHLVRIEPTPHVIEPIGRARSFDTNRSLAEDRNVNRDELEVLAAACRAVAHIQVVSSFEKGPVGRTLRDYAKKCGADLIVMASHSHGGKKRTALGSVTEYLIRHANVPVLVVKGRAAFVGPTVAESFSKIVVPLDGSTLSETIVTSTKTLALMLKSSVIVVQVLTPESYPQEQAMDPILPWWETEIGRARDYLGRVAADFAGAGVPVTTEVLLSDDIAGAILDFTARCNADIIAIATSGSGGMSRFVFGSVADELTRRATVSLLAMHPNGKTTEGRTAEQSRARALAGA